LNGRTETKLRQGKEPPHKFIEDKIHHDNPTIEWAGGSGGYWTSADINDIPEAMNAIPSVEEAVRRLGYGQTDGEDRMSLSPEMKREVINYVMNYTKGLIEDEQACPEIGKAFFRDQVTSGELEDYVEACKAKLLSDLP